MTDLIWASWGAPYPSPALRICLMGICWGWHWSNPQGHGTLLLYKLHHLFPVSARIGISCWVDLPWFQSSLICWACICCCSPGNFSNCDLVLTSGFHLLACSSYSVAISFLFLTISSIRPHCSVSAGPSFLLSIPAAPLSGTQPNSLHLLSNSPSRGFPLRLSHALSPQPHNTHSLPCSSCSKLWSSLPCHFPNISLTNFWQLKLLVIQAETL